MVIFYSYVKLPEGMYSYILLKPKSEPSYVRQLSDFVNAGALPANLPLLTLRLRSRVDGDQ